MVWLCKPKYSEKAKLCDTHTHSFIVYINYIYKDTVEDDATTFDTSNELERQLYKGKNWKVIGLIKDKFCGKIMKKFVGLRLKTL